MLCIFCVTFYPRIKIFVWGKHKNNTIVFFMNLKSLWIIQCDQIPVNIFKKWDTKSQQRLGTIQRELYLVTHILVDELLSGAKENLGKSGSSVPLPQRRGSAGWILYLSQSWVCGTLGRVPWCFQDQSCAQPRSHCWQHTKPAWNDKLVWDTIAHVPRNALRTHHTKLAIWTKFRLAAHTQAQSKHPHGSYSKCMWL